MLTLAIALKQADAVARLLYRVGVPETRSNLGAFRDDIAAVLSRYQGRNLEEIDASSALRDLLDLAVRYHVRVPREYALLSRAAISTEGILRQLDPRMDIGGTTLPLLKGLLMSRLSAGSLQEGLLKGMLKFQELAQDVPVQLSQLLMDLEGGKFLVNVRAAQLDDLTAALRRLAVVLMAALLGAALVVGAFISLSRQDWSFHGVPLLGVIAIAAGAMLFGAVGSWYFVVVRLKKIRLARWMKPPRDS
jgi:ubiquinone biosynthesis protein